MFKWLGQQTEKKKRLWKKDFKIAKKRPDKKQVVSSVDDSIKQNKVPQKVPNTSLNSILKKAIAEAEQIVGSIKTRAQAEAEDEAAKIVGQARQEAEEIKRKAETAIEKQLEEILSGINRKTEVAEIEPPVQLKEEVTAEEVKEEPPAQLKEEATAEEVKEEPPAQLKEEATAEEVKEEPPAQLKEEATAEEVKEEPPAQLKEEVTAEEVKEDQPAQLKEEAPVSELTEETEEKHGKEGTTSVLTEKGGQTLYAGEIEIAIATPVELKMVSKFYDYLQTVNELKILRTTGSWDQGTTITVVLGKPIPLVSIVAKMTGVKDIEVTPELVGQDEAASKVSSALLAKKKGKGVRRITVVLESV